MRPEFPSFEEEVAFYTAAQLARRAMIREAHAVSPAIIVTGHGRETLVIITPEMNGHGKMRATWLDHDGPTGHATADDLERVVIDIDAHCHPSAVRPASDDDVIAWTSTPEFQAGAEHVARVQAANSAGYRRQNQETP